MSDVTKLPQGTFVERSHIRSVVRDEIRLLMERTLAPAIGRAIREIRAEIEAGFRDAMSEFAYRGSWSEGVIYKRGNFVSTGGNLWHCDHDNQNARPGTGNNWSLAVTSGRDGRDGRDAPSAPEPRTVKSNVRS